MKNLFILTAIYNAKLFFEEIKKQLERKIFLFPKRFYDWVLFNAVERCKLVYLVIIVQHKFAIIF